MTPAGPLRRGDVAWLAVLATPAVVLAAGVFGPMAAMVLTVLVVQGLVLGSTSAAGRAGDVVARTARASRWTLLRALPVVVGTAIVLVALDAGVGWILDGPPAERDANGRGGVIDLLADPPPASRDPRISGEAMAASPWASDYFAELDALRYEYVPYIGAQELPTRGRFFNTADGVRRSYVPEGADTATVPEVWFFGGSALWGEGQRDLHTIPSEVARQAERDGVALRAVNFGGRGQTAFQAMLAFERALAHRPTPDLVVFYDGFNELSTQLETPEGLGPQPTVFQLDVVLDAYDVAPPLPGHREPVPAEPTVWREYLATSVLRRLADRVGSLSPQPAAAESSQWLPDEADREAAIDNAVRIYRRSVDLIRAVAQRHEVRTVLSWQPAERWAEYERVTQRTATYGEGVDLSRALDHPTAAVYLDSVHTNELGARLVAAALWPAVRDRLPARAR